jgi:hypothetical protein
VAQAYGKADNTKQGIAIALDVEQLVSHVNTLLNAASLINRISKILRCSPTPRQRQTASAGIRQWRHQMLSQSIRR